MVNILVSDAGIITETEKKKSKKKKKREGQLISLL